MLSKLLVFKPSYPVRIFAGLFSILIALGVCAAAGISDIAADTLKERDDQFNGRLIEAGANNYIQQCSRCHGVQGKGVDGQGPAISSLNFLGGPKFVNGKAEQDASGNVINYPSQRLKDLGYGGTIEQYVASVTAAGMPVKSSAIWGAPHPVFSNLYGGPLRPDQVDNVTRFVINWKKQPFTVGVIDSLKPGSESGPAPTPAPLTPAQEAGKAVYLGAAGCTACHAVKGVGNQGGTGPALSKIYADAKTIITSPEYKAAGGKATTPEDYIKESILVPNQYIYPDCPQGPCAAGVMPQTFATTIKADDLANLVQFLSSLGR